jgi:hypothetical protein
MNQPIQVMKQKTLNDVILLRPLAILLLVVYHAFIVYRGGWRAPAGFHEIKTYWWIATASYSFMLELFVMMSGYVFGFQMLELKKKYTLKYLISNKFKRLIVPSIVFSILYYVIFRWNDPLRPLKAIYDVLCGIGHMWFLPMLFWCFIGAYLLLLIKASDGLKLTLCICIAIVSFLPLPFGIGSSMYYLLFFYLGILLYKNREYLLVKFGSRKWIYAFGMAYLITFVCFTLLKEEIVFTTDSIVTKALEIAFSKAMMIIYATLGCLFAWLLANTFLQVKKAIPTWIIAANRLCFGVYLYQQFILKILYYHTSLPMPLGAYWLPVLSFILTLVLSMIFSFLTRTTKIGRMLIG